MSLGEKVSHDNENEDAVKKGVKTELNEEFESCFRDDTAHPVRCQ